MNILEGESSRMWGGIHMVGILLVSMIWWDHPNPFNHFYFSYIMTSFSWKWLRNIKKGIDEIIGWRLCEESCFSDSWGLQLSVKILWIILIKYQRKCMCVLEQLTTERKLATSREFGCIFHFYLINTAACFFPIKSFSFILHDSLYHMFKFHWYTIVLSVKT